MKVVQIVTCIYKGGLASWRHGSRQIAKIDLPRPWVSWDRPVPPSPTRTIERASSRIVASDRKSACLIFKTVADPCNDSDPYNCSAMVFGAAERLPK